MFEGLRKLLDKKKKGKDLGDVTYENMTEEEKKKKQEELDRKNEEIRRKRNSPSEWFK